MTHHARQNSDSTAPANAAPAARRIRTQRVVNVRLLVATGVLMIALPPAAYFWHRHQAWQQTSAFLTQVDQLVAAGDYVQAAEVMHRYVQQRPDDHQARVRLAELYDRDLVHPRQRQRAVELYRQAVAVARDRNDLQVRLAELSLELGNWSDALQHAEQALAAIPLDARSLRVRAWARDAMGRSSGRYSADDVLEALRAAVERNPDDVALSLRLASFYRQELRDMPEAERVALADAVVDRLVARNEANVEVRLARHRYRAQHGLAGAPDDLERALELAPDDVEVLLAAAQAASRTGDPQQVAAYCERLVSVAPGDRRGYALWAAALAARGEYAAAIDVLEEGVRRLGSDFDLFLQLAEIRILGGQLDEAQAALDESISHLARILPEVSRADKADLEGRLKYAQARLHLARGEYQGAVDALKPALVSLEAGSNRETDRLRQMQAWFDLGGAYAALELWDLSAEAYERAVRLRPDIPRPVVAAGESWEAAGRFDHAIRSYQQALTMPAAPPSTWALLTRAQYRQQLAAPAEQRDWRNFERSLAQALEVSPDEPLLVTLSADFEAIRGQPQEALARLEAGRAALPDSALVARAWVTGCIRWATPEAADAALQAYRAQFGDDGSLLMLEVDVLAARGQAPQAEELLRSRLDGLSAAERETATYRLAQLRLEQGDRVEARRLLDELATARPGRLMLVRQLAELALDALDLEDLARREAQLAEIEGADGTWWRLYRGQRLLAQADRGELEPLDALGAAAELQGQIQSLRPSWPEGFVLKARIAERYGRNDEAIASLQAAIDLGARGLFVYELLVTQLYEAGRFAEADQYLSRLRSMAAASQTLSELAISVSIRQGELERAQRLARESLERRPQDAMSHVWLAQTLLMSDDLAGAEQALGRAVEVAPGDSRGWIALLAFYARSQRIDEARATLARIEQASVLAAEERMFLRAQGHDLLGEVDEADRCFREALELAPDNAAIQQRAAAFFIGRDDQQAEQSLRHALAAAPQSGTIRRVLAQLLMNRGDPAAWQEAWDLMATEVGSGGADAAADTRTRALLLARRGGAENLREAIELLEASTKRAASFQPEDHLLLASLYQSSGQIEAAREQLSLLASRDGADPAHVALYVALLLNTGRHRDAGPWLSELEALEPDSFRTLALRVRWLAAESRGAEIESRLEEYVARELSVVDDPQRRARLMGQVAQLYGLVGLDAPAERWFDELTRVNPQGYSLYAGWLQTKGRSAEATELCLDTAVDDPTPPPVTLAAAIAAQAAASSLPDELRARLSAAIDNVLQLHPSDRDLLFASGTWHFLHDDAERAIDLYRRVLEVDPRHVPALNNLALKLAERQTGDREPLELIARAIQLAGPQPDLRDTEAMIHLHLGDVDAALDRLRRLTLDVPDSGVYHFHLALACQRAGLIDEARVSFRKANRQGLIVEQLSPSEQELLVQLRQRLAP